MSVDPNEILWAEHAPPSGYPPGVIAVPERIPGLSFFPGGYGLWRPSLEDPAPPFPIAGIMILGHDFHSEKGYEASAARGYESPTQPTWLNLRALLEGVSIPMKDCFFTNIYMGLRVGAKTTGPFPGANDRIFSEHCSRFLRRQLQIQRPHLVITLGKYVPRFLARLSSDLRSWENASGFSQLDEVGPLQRNVRFDDSPPVVPCVAALTHPSLRNANVRWRAYRGAVGDAAERMLLRDAMNAAFGKFGKTDRVDG
jgi:hypothetical protein